MQDNTKYTDDKQYIINYSKPRSACYAVINAIDPIHAEKRAVHAYYRNDTNKVRTLVNLEKIAKTKTLSTLNHK